MSDHHFCPDCGGHIKGERCELCAPDPEDRELDASEIHDVSPAADGSLLKQVTTAGEDAGPQQLATPSPLCDVEAKVRTLRPKQSEPRAVTWRGDGADPPADDLPAALRAGLETMRLGEVAKVTVVDAERDTAVEYELEVLDWVEELDCDRERPKAATKRTVSRPPLMSWREPRNLDEVRVVGALDDGAGFTVDYGALEPRDPAEKTAVPGERARDVTHGWTEKSGWRLDEDATTETGAPVCEGLLDVLRTMRCFEVADVRIREDRGFPGAGDLAGRLQLVAVVEDGDEELMRNRGAYSHDDREAQRLVQVGEKKKWGNAHFQRGDHGRAIRRYGRAVELGENDDPDDVDDAMLDLLATVRCNRAAAHLKAGDFGAAKADCDAVLARDPRNDKAKLRRATALQELGSLDAARDALLDLAKHASNAAVARDARRKLDGLKAALREHRRLEKDMYAGVYESAPTFGPKPDPAPPPPPAVEEDEATRDRRANDAWRRSLMEQAAASVERQRANYADRL